MIDLVSVGHNAGDIWFILYMVQLKLGAGILLEGQINLSNVIMWIHTINVKPGHLYYHEVLTRGIATASAMFNPSS